MKKILTKMTAVMSAAIMSVSAAGIMADAADTEKTPVTVSFDCGGEGVAFAEKTDPTLFETAENSNGYIVIPEGTLEKEGYVFTGWTTDGVYAYQSSDVFNFGSEAEVNFEPVWYKRGDTEVHNISYNVVFDGEEQERPTWLKDTKGIAGQVITPDLTEIKLDNAFSRGWTYDGYTFGYAGHAMKMIIPDHDVELTPIWFRVVTFTFYAGDVDRLNSNDTYSFPKNEASSTELAAKDRFSRNGFEISGWLSDYDGEIYLPGATVTAPGVDVTYTAVWSPKTYNVVFKQSGGGNIKVSGETDTAIICPEPTETKAGMTFQGWKAGDGNIYPAGSEYTILGAAPGLGISLTAVWVAGNAEPVTTAPITTTAEETTATTAVTTTADTPAENQEIAGDANLDGKISLADSVSILQYIANKDKYPLSAEALANADVYDKGDGITPNDALAVQKFDAKIIDSLPESILE